MRTVLVSQLSHRSIPARLAGLALVLTLPALGVGWQLDDHYQRLMMTARSSELGISAEEIFSTLKGDPALTRRYMDWGVLPWWTVETLRLAFFRPLAVLTHWLDYRLWPDSPALMHAQSLLWFGALVAAAAALYRRTLGPGPVAGLAALLYAVDDAHAPAAAWLANRNALLAACFGFLCLAAHDRWRREGWRPGAVLSPVFLALALASGEMAVATAGYLAAHALFLERGPLCRRVWTMAPAGAVLAGWAVVYRSLGFGATGSGMYVDPLASPALFAGAFLERAPLLLLGQWSPIPAEAGTFLPGEVARGLWWAAMVLLALLGLVAAPLVRRDRTARFWGLGMLLSLLPISATYPANRLLFFTGLGAMGLLAQLLGGLRSQADWAPSLPAWRIPARALGWLFVAVHLVLAPLAMPLGAYAVKPFGEPMVRAAASVPADPAIAGQDLVLVNAPDYLFFVGNIPTLKLLEGQPRPRRIRALVTGPVPLRLIREDERSLRVRAEGGLFSGALGRLFRGPEHPMAAGDTVRLTGFTAVVAAATPDGQPEEILYRFPVRLEDPSLLWLRWEEGVYVPFAPPGIGGSVSLLPAMGPFESWGMRSYVPHSS